MSYYQRAEITPSGHVRPTRTLVSRVEEPCLTCGKLVPVGTLVYWGAHVGVWHLTCEWPKDPGPDAHRVEFPPACGKCFRPVVDPVEPPVEKPDPGERWCRACALKHEGFRALARDAIRRRAEQAATKAHEPDELPAAIGGDERF